MKRLTEENLIKYQRATGGGGIALERQAYTESERRVWGSGKEGGEQNHEDECNQWKLALHCFLPNAFGAGVRYGGAMPEQ